MLQNSTTKFTSQTLEEEHKINKKVPAGVEPTALYKECVQHINHYSTEANQ